MMALVIDIVSAAGQLEAAILDVTTTDPDILVCCQVDEGKSKIASSGFGRALSGTFLIQRELRGVFEACSDAIDRKSVNPVVVKAAISIAEEYRQVIEGLSAATSALKTAGVFPLGCHKRVQISETQITFIVQPRMCTVSPVSVSTPVKVFLLSGSTMIPREVAVAS